MGLDRQIETIEHAAARFPAALAVTWDGDQIVKETRDKIRGGARPGQHRQYVFDLADEAHPADEYRFIVSVEAHSEFGRVLHVSASLRAGRIGMLPELQRARSQMLLEAIAGDNKPPRPPDHHLWTVGGVVHFIWRLDHAHTH